MADKQKSIRCKKCGEINTGVTHFCFTCGARLQNEIADELAKTYIDTTYDKPIDKDLRAEAVSPKADAKEKLKATQENSQSPIKAEDAEENSATLSEGEPSASFANEDIESAFSRLLNSEQGTKGADSDKTCSDSKNKAENSAKGKSRCDTPIQSVTITGAGVDTASKKSRFKGKSFITRAVTLGIAIISAILFFVPFISVDTIIPEVGTHTTSFSPVEIIGIGFDGMQRYSEEELARSSETARLKYVSASLMDHMIYAPNSDITEELMDEYLKLSVSLDLKAQRGDEKFSVVMSTLLWIAYAIISIITISFGVYELLNPPIDKKTDEPLATATTAKLLIYNAITLPIYIVLSAHASVATRLGGFFGSGGVHLGFGAWLSFVFALAVFAYPAFWVVRNAIISYKDGKSGIITRKTAAVAIAAAAFIATTIPSFTVSFAAYTRGEILEETYYSSALDRNDFSSQEMNAFFMMDEYISGNTFIESAKALAKEQDISEDVSATFFNRLLIGIGMDIDVFYVFLTILSLLCSLFSAITLRNATKHALSEKCQGGRAPAVLFTIFAMAYLILGIVFISVSNGFVGGRLSRYVTFGLSFAPIITAAFALASAIMIKGNRTEATKEYDAPDVSFSPYVI